MINGIILKQPKTKYNQDSTLDDVSSSLNDGSTAELSYDLAEVEGSLKLKADAAKGGVASAVLKEKGSKATPKSGESASASTRTLKSSGTDSASFSSRGQEEILLTKFADESSSDESDYDTLLKKAEQPSQSGKSSSKGPQGVSDNKNQEMVDEGVVDESQVLLKTGSSSADNVRKRRNEKNDDDTIDV